MKELKYLQGKEYWRSLDQLADTPEFRNFLEREFPEGASEIKNQLTRRHFLSLMGASIALAGLSACRRPVEKIIPYVKAPERIIPGIPQYYATTMPLGTSAYGVVVESHEGRPTKIEGNEQHPSSLGKSNTQMQASILNLYDPDRSQRSVHNGNEKDWSEFVVFWKKLYQEYKANQGEGLAILTDTFSSLSLSHLMEDFKTQFPKSDLACYAPVSQENILQGMVLATGKEYLPVYHYDKAAVILSLDADFLLTENENVTNTKNFTQARRVNTTTDKMNRLYSVESSYSITGAMADHRLPLSNSEIPGFVATLAKEITKLGIPISVSSGIHVQGDTKIDQKWIAAVAKDLVRNRNMGLVVAGSRQSALVHALVYVINSALGNVGQSITYRDTKDLNESKMDSLTNLVERMAGGKISTLVMLGGNPVYNAPTDINFREALEKVSNSIHLSPYRDETSHTTTWHIPQSHYLESWGDCRSADGTLSLIQPLIAPLFESHDTVEVLSLLATGTEQKSYDVVRGIWEHYIPSGDFDQNWRQILHDGVLAGSKMSTVFPSMNGGVLGDHLRQNPVWSNIPNQDNFEISFQISPAVHDGRFANNGWLQELPDTVTKLSWDNAALMSHKTAEHLGVKNEDVVVLNLQGGELVVPVWILPGQAHFTVSLALGYGRSAVGRVGNGVGANAFLLRTMESLNFDLGLLVRKTRDTYPLASTQDHGSMEGRPLVREATLEDYQNNPQFAEEMVKHFPLVSLWDEHGYEEGYQWGMSIDLNACTGCNACTIACQSENNIPIIGKEQVKEGREMHWIRLDRYFAGDLENPEVVHQPVACHHCEMAPCEQVCPVAATVHDDEGLNVMTYNRCIGTRYCSNNCPFKVRRFNFFNYTKDLPEIVQMAQNPDVTVRSRGVMEKCTYCVQRISSAKITAKNENRTVKDGEIQTACEQACPSDAITFGNINDPKSQVVKNKQNDRTYDMLAELNIKPRTSYLAKLRNPNPGLT
jgi:molybdopterin-containing oxidoreductase family iron-sulfur binding subunit